MKGTTKLYLAILNHGWIRAEIAARLLPAMRKMEGVEVVWENPSKTWHHPISSNRNRIVKRFLATDCDYLLMMDDDVVPLDNPAVFMRAGKDVVGFPAKVRQEGRGLNWVAYVLRPGTEDEYAPVDFARVDHAVQLLKVDVVGTGCILIKRAVLEALKAPFHTDFDEDGVLTIGTDFAFCRRAAVAGFEIYTAPQHVCEHYKEIGMLDFGAYSDSDGVDPAAVKYGIPWGGFAVSPNDWEFIRTVIRETGAKRILEFGCGLSSLLMSEHAEVTSYETDHEWAERIKEKIGLHNHLAVKMWDGRDFLIRDLGKYDLAFVDGPTAQAHGGPGRKEAVRAAAALCDYIIVHDARREEETRWQEKYLNGTFRLARRSGYHQACCHWWVRG